MIDIPSPRPELDPRLFTNGPLDARIMIVGESWGKDEAIANEPFVGASGNFFNHMLAEAGLIELDEKGIPQRTSTILCTNVVDHRPPNNELAYFFHPTDEAKTRAPFKGLYPSDFVLGEVNRLWKLIDQVDPDLIIACGNYALWALMPEGTFKVANKSIKKPHEWSGKVPTGIVKWRGSMTWTQESSDTGNAYRCLPLIHPAATIRQYSYRPPSIHDLKVRVPKALNRDWFDIDPMAQLDYNLNASEVLEILHRVKHKLDQAKEQIPIAMDVETSRTLITCFGLGFGTRDAITIPFVKLDGDYLVSYWEPSVELSIVKLLRQIIRHPMVLCVGQNFIYDMQYIKLNWNATPGRNNVFDTMTAQHLCWPGMPKGLDFLSSLYCEYHCYWKDDLKEWAASEVGFDRALRYNCIDCIRTFECFLRLQEQIKSMGIEHLWERTMRRYWFAYDMMERGTRVDEDRRKKLVSKFSDAATIRSRVLDEALPKSLMPDMNTKTPWYRSPKQQQVIFYTNMGLKPVLHQKTRRPTLDDDALEVLSNREPALAPLFKIMADLRSIGVIKKNFLDAARDPDGRMRSEFSPTGTETFRFSSSRNAWNRGCNMQTIPKDKD